MKDLHGSAHIDGDAANATLAVESTAFVRRETREKTEPSTLTAKRVLAAAGLTLVAAGCGAVAYHQSVTHAVASLGVEPVTLEANQVGAFTTLTSGTPFLLRNIDKNLCMDDGGGTSNGATKFVLAPCNPASPNQVFRYVASTKQIRSVAKPAMCVDDGGGNLNGETKFHLWECQTMNFNQRFDFLPDTQQFKSQTKGKCLDDGGGRMSGQTQFHLWDCFPLRDTRNVVNQRFEVVPRAELASVATTTASDPMVSTVPSETLDPMELLRSRQPIVFALLNSPGACVDDGGARFNGQADFRTARCEPNADSQAFVYDVASMMFRSARKPTLCLDDGGANPGVTRFHLWDCDPAQRNQKFLYDPAGQRLRNPTKNLCMTNLNGVYTLLPCNDSAGQKFSISRSLPSDASALAPQLPRPMPALSIAAAMDLLRSRQPIVFALPNSPGSCVDDGGARFNGQADFRTARCDAGASSQAFVFDAASMMFRSARKPTLCLDDGGAAPGVTRFHLWDCDPAQRNQKFLYDAAGQRLRNPTKNLCMTNLNGVYTLLPCNNSPDQSFSLMGA